jgi:hypothetical protein
MQMHSITTSPATSVSNYLELKPIMAAMKSGNDHMPKNTLPSDTNGTIQENAEEKKLPKVTLYNAHGILTKTDPNSLIGYA